MYALCLLFWLSFIGQSPAGDRERPAQQPPALEASAWFAFVDTDYIFTIEMVKPGVPLLNFVSMADKDAKLQANNVRLALENRKAAAKVFVIETGVSGQPMVTAFLTLRARTSFRVRMNGEFGKAEKILGASVRLGNEELKLAPLSSFEFEILASKVNQINLGSPDFSEDWRVLRLQKLGTRSLARGRTGTANERRLTP